MLVDEIRRQMMAAMKAGDIVRKEVLRVAMGEITFRPITHEFLPDRDLAPLSPTVEKYCHCMLKTKHAKSIFGAENSGIALDE